MAGHSMEVREARQPEKRSYRKLSRLEIHKVRGENGGHRVLHHFTSDGMAYHEPQEHMFGHDEGHLLMAHVAKHLGIKQEAQEEGEPMEQEAEEEEA